MPGKAASPEQTADVIALREAGFTVAMIAERTLLSPSTINRILASSGARKGAAAAAVIDAARDDLKTLLGSKDAIAAEVARLIADDLAQARLLRDRITAGAEYLTAKNLREAALMMRAAAAMSTALKNTSDMTRQALGYDKARGEVAQDDLPVLQLQEISNEKAKEMREGRAANDDGAIDLDDGILAQS